MQEIQKYAEKEVILVILGNKCDTEARAVSIQEA
jgi:hypothetical protein